MGLSFEIAFFVLKNIRGDLFHAFFPEPGPG
jgi:hypothetical protein